MTRFVVRRFDDHIVNAMVARGVEPAFARVLASRGVKSADEISLHVSALLPPSKMLNAEKAASILADAIQKQENIVIIGDYDCDGATATCIAYIGLRLLGAQNVSYLIPDREKDGYGLSKSLVEEASALGADLIITVDNGISAVDPVAFAKEKNLKVIITDHHLPAEILPAADCIVDPNQKGDSFPSKSIAGCGVIFYVLIALRTELRERGVFTPSTQPNLLNLIDLVALGTIADVVPLDQNNRIFIKKGIEMIRQGKLRPGMAALLSVGKRNANSLTSTDIAFSIAPRINASGRLGNMKVGVECLLSPDLDRALEKAQELERLNKERKELEKQSLQAALSTLDPIDETQAGLCFYDENWHGGIVGLVSSRIRDKTYRPTICFTDSNEESSNGKHIKGSGRSIPGVHLRNVLAEINKKAPGLIVKFGGHSQAAGLTILKDRYQDFKKLFNEEIQDEVSEDTFTDFKETDGPLEAGDFFNFQLARELKNYVWGQNFPEPLFLNSFRVVKQEILNGAHLKMTVETDGVQVPAIWFRRKLNVPEQATFAYRFTLNEWNGRITPQLIIEGMEVEETW